MNYVVTTLGPSFLIGSSAFLQATRAPIKSWLGLKFGQIGLWTYEVTSSFFHVPRTTIKAWMSLKFCRIGTGTYELAALEHLEKSP